MRQPGSVPTADTGRPDSAPRDRPLAIALVKHAHGLVDPPLSGLGRLRTVDRQHMTESVAIGQPVEERSGNGICVQSSGEILGHRYLARLSIELQVDFDLISR